MMETSKYFSKKELACKGTGEVKLANGFLRQLDELRVAYGEPMIVNSCCRSSAYNKKIGGNPRSLHVYDDPFYKTGGTCAIDIAMVDSLKRKKLIALALEHGWTVGVAKTFLHLDLRSVYAKLPQIVYVY